MLVVRRPMPDKREPFQGYQYAGMRGNQRAMEAVLEAWKRAWRCWLSRRSHQSAIRWDLFV